MIIELFGLPAAGKTTCANSLMHKNGYVRPEFSSSLSIFWHALLFWTHYPIHSIRLFILILRYSRVRDMYTKFVHGLGVRLARYMVPVSGIRVIDEGIIQNILTLSDKKLSREELLKLLDIPIISDTYLHIIISSDLQSQYAKKRGRMFSRTNSNEEDIELLAVVLEHEKVIAEILKKRSFDVREGSCETVAI